MEYIDRSRNNPFPESTRTVIPDWTLITFPDGVEIIAMPKATTISQAGFDYGSTYEKEANVVVLKRHYQFKRSSAVCSPEDFNAMKAPIEAMVKDLKSQIIVRAI